MMNPAAVMKSMIPVVMAGVIGIYGLIVAVIIVGMSAFRIAATHITRPQACHLDRGHKALCRELDGGHVGSRRQS